MAQKQCDNTRQSRPEKKRAKQKNGGFCSFSAPPRATAFLDYAVCLVYYISFVIVTAADFRLYKKVRL